MSEKVSTAKLSSRIAALLLGLCLVGITVFLGTLGKDTAYAADIATGTSGTVDWVIDESGVLTLTPSGGADSGTLARSGGAYNSSPWSDYASDVKSFKIAEGKEVFAGSSISHMFYYCNYLTTVDFTGFNTSGATNINYLFYRCESLTSVDLSGLDTSNVTTMNQMFYYCESITSINVSGLDFSNVSNMSKMFEGCGALRSLDLTNFSGTASLNTNLMFGAPSDFTPVALTSVVLSDVTNANIKSAIPTPPSGMVNPAASSTTTGKWINNANDTVYDSLASVGAGTYEAQVIYNIANATIADIPSYTYDGSAYTPVPALTLNDRPLVVSEDFTYTYATADGTPVTNPTSAGTYTVIITGEGDYNNTTSATFEITPMSLPADCIASIASQVYSGNSYKPVPVVTVNGTVLQATRDFTYSYKDANDQLVENPTNAGTYSVVVTGTGNYQDSAQANFSITARDLTGATVSSIASIAYSGNPYKPVPEIVLNGVTLQAGVDFSYTYSDNRRAVVADPINAGTYTVSIEGEGNYAGSLSTNFTIDAKSIASGIIGSINDYTYDGNVYAPVPVVQVDGVALDSSSDFTYEYLDAAGEPVAQPIEAGDYVLQVSGIGNYADTLSASFVIEGAPLEGATVEAIPSHTYDGNAYKPVPVVMLGGTALKAETDFVYRYVNAAGNPIAEPKDVGTYTVMIEAAGNYSGEISTTFDIVEAPDSGDSSKDQSGKTLPSTGDSTAPVVGLLALGIIASFGLLGIARKCS